MTEEPIQQPITFDEPTQQPLVFEPQNIVMTEEKREQNRKALAHLGRTGEQLEENARLWQSEAFNIWIGLENKRMGTKVATGAGKTRLSLAIAHDWLHTEQHHNPVVLFFVPSIKLATQTYNTYRMWGLRVGRICTGFNESSPNKQVYITTYNSAAKLFAIPHIAKRKQLLILDECHRAGAENAFNTFTHNQGDACLLLSATPNRTDGVCVMHMMNTAPEDKPCLDHVCHHGIHYELDLLEGINQSRNGDDELDFEFHVVYVEMTPEEQAFHDSISTDIKKQGAILHSLAEKHSVNFKGGNPFSKSSFGLSSEVDSARNWYSVLLQQRKRFESEVNGRFDTAKTVLMNEYGCKYALFHETITGIERLSQMCKNIGINPHVYHSGATMKEDTLVLYPELNNPAFLRRVNQWSADAEKELKRWERSSSDVLLTCKSLKEGFDAPDLDGIVMMSGTNSVRSRIQTIGRVFRGSKKKKIWFLALKGAESDMACFYELIHETGIHKVPEKIHYHTAGVTI